MVSDVPFLDCCSNPRLEAPYVLYEASHDLESVLRCQNCQMYWFYRFSEYVDWVNGEDDLTSWYCPLNNEEAGQLLAVTQRSAVDLSFLARRPGWIDDRDGVRRVPGIPRYPRS